MMDIKKDVKGRIPVIYARVSTGDQTGTLPTQVSSVKEWLKRNKIPQSGLKVFKEQVSGSSTNPPKLTEAIEFILKNPEKYFLIVRDWQRISRNWRFGGKNMVDLYLANVPVVSTLQNQISGTIDTIQTGDWLIGLQMSIGAQEIDQGRARIKSGVEASKKKGILSGQPKLVYPDEPLNPYRELDRLLKAGVGQSEGSRRLGKSSSWFRKNRDFFKEVRERGGDELMEEWFKLTDYYRELEQKHGSAQGRTTKGRSGSKRFISGNPKVLAVRRMTGGFVQRPYDFPVPTIEELEEYFNNYEKYLKVR